MSSPINVEALSHEALRQILVEHERYHASKGKEGQRADLSAYIIKDFDFSGLDLSSIHAQSSVFMHCHFVGCDLYSVDFGDSKIINANFGRANLGKGSFYSVDASGACFDEANVAGADFNQAVLRGATFRNANLRGTSFSGCDLTNALFDGADLDYASVANNIENGINWKG